MTSVSPQTAPPGPTEQTLQDPRWTAVRRRDASADGSFYYSVKSTGVYCRPSCSARLPRPENVAFHRTAQDAEQAGFRPCRRCRPEGDSVAQRLSAKIVEACRLLETSEGSLGLQQLARQVGLSPSHLHRNFKRLLGTTPNAYARARREGRVRADLSRAPSVTEAIYAAGYGSSSRFYENSAQLLGMTPTAYRQGGAGATIAFAVGQCSLGAVLVARSQAGVCAIALGDDPDGLTRELQDRFPQAELVGDDPDFQKLVARVVGFVESPRIGLDLPLDIQGTAFQKRVWEALSLIPAGETISYSALARKLGAPQAARAVASACAANRLAVAIPCHRVVRTDGSLSGYRWGVERKSALLDRERQATQVPSL